MDISSVEQLEEECNIDTESNYSMDDYIESDFSEEIRADTPYAQEERCEFELEYIRWSEHTQLLIRHIEETQFTDHYESMSLHTAVLKNSLALLDVLLAQPNIDLNSTTCENNTALHLSLKMKRSYSFIMRLVKAGCDVTATNIHKETPLHIAVLRSNTDIAYELIKRGAHLNAQDERKRTPLHYAILCKNLKTVCLLLYCGGSVHVLARDSKTLFDIALLCNFSDVVGILKQYYSDREMLLSAAKVANPLAISFAIELVNTGVDVNCVDVRGYNLLSLSLANKTGVLFELVWPQVGCHVLAGLKQPFLLSYIYCEFPPSKWLKCLLLMLESPYARFLISKHNNYNLFGDVMAVLDKKHVQQSDRLVIIYNLLRIGLEINELVIGFLYLYYGFNEELESIIYCSNCSHLARSNKFQYFQLNLFFATEVEPTSEIIFRFVKRQIIKKFNLWPEGVSSADVYLFRFHSLPLEMKRELLDLNRCDKIAEILQEMQEVPSLLELCRNQTRRFIRGKSKIKRAYQFYDAVRKLSVPPVIEDIICFIMPLY